jgi:hypothetical protein
VKKRLGGHQVVSKQPLVAKGPREKKDIVAAKFREKKKTQWPPSSLEMTWWPFGSLQMT